MIDYSRAKQCKNSSGGNSEFYVFPFIKYNRSQITVINNILTVFPYNVIYDLNSNNISFKEDIDEEDGGVSYTQTTSSRFPKIQSKDDYKILSQQDYRVITKDNNGNYRLIGLRNGMKGKFSKDTGVNRSDFNGFDVSFDNKEENTAPFLNDLSLFNIMPIEGLLIEDGNNNIIEDGNNNELTN